MPDARKGGLNACQMIVSCAFFMKKRYVVQQYFYDSGRVRVIPPIETCDEVLISVEEMRSRDYYRAVFDTLEEAERFYYECLNDQGEG